MIEYIFFSVIIILILELINFFNFKNLLLNYLRLLKKTKLLINSKNISDNSKEKFLKIFSIKFFQNSIKILFFLMIIFIIIFLINFFYPGTISKIISLKFIIFSILIAFVYINLKKYVKSKL